MREINAYSKSGKRSNRKFSTTFKGNSHRSHPACRHNCNFLDRFDCNRRIAKLWPVFRQV